MSWSSDYWVYFERLQSDATKPKKRPNLGDLYEIGKNRVTDLNANIKKTSGNGQKIISMANTELAKEQALLRQCFGVNTTFDLQSEDSIHNLIDTINWSLNLKTVYERSKHFILNSENRTDKRHGKQGYIYFHNCLTQAINNNKSLIEENITPLFKPGVDFGTEVCKVIDNIFDNIILPEAINKAFSKSDWDSKTKSADKNAYNDLLEVINQAPTNNPFVTGIRSAWGLDKIVNQLKSDILGLDNENELQNYITKRGGISNINSLIRKKFTNHTSGLTPEALYDQILSMVANGLAGTHIDSGSGQLRLQGDITAKGLQELGRKQMRADGSIIFNADTAPIEQMLANTTDNSRKTSINLFNQIGKYINNINNSFIVYVNEKNYLMYDAEFGGYSAGHAMSLEAIEPELSNVIDNVPDLIEVILNAGKGAINEGNTDDASEIIARAIAYTLFDDWNYIGVSSSSGQSIHVMNLNGVLIPLSAFLFSLGKAIDASENNANDFASATIHPAAYDTSDSAAYDDVDNSIQNWYNTINFGKANTTISFHFMKSIQSFLNF